MILVMNHNSALHLIDLLIHTHQTLHLNHLLIHTHQTLSMSYCTKDAAANLVARTVQKLRFC
jgi:hypothetical protein